LDFDYRKASGRCGANFRAAVAILSIGWGSEAEWPTMSRIAGSVRRGLHHDHWITVRQRSKSGETLIGWGGSTCRPFSTTSIATSSPGSLRHHES
jgi:hypothetical protein